jgi:hypothetical protein
MKSLELALKNQPVAYIARDLERALGLSLAYQNYHIITNSSPFANEVQKTNPRVIIIPADKLLDTIELLELSKDILTKLSDDKRKPDIIVFKNTSQIETWCQEQGFNLLNPSAKFANQIEEKISQLDWLDELTRFLPPHQRSVLKDLHWPDVKGRILQFNRAHTGGGTMRLESKEQLDQLQTQFPNRPVRLTEFVTGPMLTSNNVVWGDIVLVGNISYQITGLPPFTDRPFATIGNDWGLPYKLLNSSLKQQYLDMAQAVGRKLASNGWKGLFGIDVVLEEATQKLYLIEINARQPASTTYESQLQEKQQAFNSEHTTTFEAHLTSLLGVPYEGQKLIEINDGAQIIQRVTPHTTQVSKATQHNLSALNLSLISYPNTKLGEDLLRIQSAGHLLAQPSIFNELGQKIADLLS